MHNKQTHEHLEAPSPYNNNKSHLNTHEIEPSPKIPNEAKIETRPQSGDVLEKARVAIAAAERATAAARAAAALVHNNSFGVPKLEGRSS